MLKPGDGYVVLVYLVTENFKHVHEFVYISSSVHTLNKQNQVNNGMNLIYLKQYFSPFSN